MAGGAAGPDPYDLRRFVLAQDEAGTYERAVTELRNGRKTSHWMWFVFPQIAGLGHSVMAERFALSSMAEAEAYLDHGVLGPRLVASTGIVADTVGRTAVDIFGRIDAQKLHSSMTLFSRAAQGEPPFALVLDRYFDGVADPGTELRI